MLVEKPMALTLADCAAMIEAARKAGVHLIVGHSHSFDAPILRTRELIASGAYGAVRMITALNYTDYLYRPRRPEELDTAQGGGAIFNQAAHQVDIVRLLGGRRGDERARADRRMGCGAADRGGLFGAADIRRTAPSRRSPMAATGISIPTSFPAGSARWGRRKARTHASPAALRNAADEAAFKSARNYGGPAYQPPAAQDLAHQHFGTVIVSCERADLRPLPNGVAIYQDGTARLDPLPLPAVPRAEVIDELYAAVVDGKPPLHDGAWGAATLEVCLAMLQSSREGRDVALTHQVAVR